ncbi:RHS repeat-associated core domain-containing protein [Acrocarpospora sp. B8E8]|uniref:RHS repeat-associated core domain-containing protein n=1 Tax=Acrocarpospora sp. B8E8 TaxID=3153572 RepID=UPI00325DDF87
MTYLSARYYDPSLGKFISTDPLLDLRRPQWANAFAYVGNNPIGFSDPTGLVTDGGGGSSGCTSASTCAAVNYDVCVNKFGKVRCAQAKAANAEAAENAAWQDFLNVLKYIGDIAAEELGLKDALKCLTTGDLGACGSTALNVLASFAGGLAGKLAAKYGLPWKWKKAYELGKKLASAISSAVDKFKGWLKAGAEAREARNSANAIAKSCRLSNSFVPGTQVLMADGTHKPIEQIKIGDRVVATDPITGKTEP